MYKRIQSDAISTTRLDENSDLITTYLGGVDIKIYRKAIGCNRMSDCIGCRS